MNIAMDVSIMVQCRTGTEEYTEGLVWGLSRIGLSIVGIGKQRSAILPDRPCLGIQPGPKRPLWEKFWWERWGIQGAVRSDFDLIHIPYMTHPPSPFRIPSLVTIHDLIPFRLEEYQARVRERAYFSQVRKNLAQAGHLVAISEATFADLQGLMPNLAAKVTVIPNGIHPAYFVKAPAADVERVVRALGLERHPRILYAGGYDFRKNVATLVQAAEVVLDRHDGELILVGGRGQAAVERRVASSRVADRIVLTPWLSREDLAALYHACDLFAYPSLYEGFGMPPAQALAAKIPLVASDIPSVRETVGDAGVLVDATAVEAWVDGLTRVIESPQLAQNLVQAGTERAARLAWDRIAVRYRELYEQLVSK